MLILLKNNRSTNVMVIRHLLPGKYHFLFLMGHLAPLRLWGLNQIFVNRPFELVKAIWMNGILDVTNTNISKRVFVCYEIVCHLSLLSDNMAGSPLSLLCSCKQCGHWRWCFDNILQYQECICWWEGGRTLRETLLNFMS